MGERSSVEFTGNLMFASTEHLIGGRASQLCDLYSLLCVAYYFIHKTLPWLSFIEDLQKKNPETNYYQKNRYKEKFCLARRSSV